MFSENQLPKWFRDSHANNLVNYGYYNVFIQRPQEFCALFNCKIPVNLTANEFLTIQFHIREKRDNYAIVYGDWSHHTNFIVFDTPQDYRAASKSRLKEQYAALLRDISGVADPLVRLKWDKDEYAVTFECSDAYYQAVKQQLQPFAAELYKWVYSDPKVIDFLAGHNVTVDV